MTRIQTIKYHVSQADNAEYFEMDVDANSTWYVLTKNFTPNEEPIFEAVTGLKSIRVPVLHLASTKFVLDLKYDDAKDLAGDIQTCVSLTSQMSLLIGFKAGLVLNDIDIVRLVVAENNLNIQEGGGLDIKFMYGLICRKRV